MPIAQFLPKALRVQALFWGISFALASTVALRTSAADDEPPPPVTAPASAPVSGAGLPDIEIRSLQLKIEKMSTNGHVVQFTSAEPAPNDRQLILLKKITRPVLALRVIKLFDPSGLPEGGTRFVAQVVRTYDDFFKLKLEDQFRGIIKLRDITLEQLDKEVADLKQKGSAPEKDSAGTPPVLEKTTPDAPLPPEDKSAQLLSDSEERELKSLAYEEAPNYEPEKDSLGVQFSLLRLPRFDSGVLYVAAAGPRYSKTFAHPVYFTDKHKQDSLSIDVSLLAAKILDYSDISGDSYTVLPLMAVGRYNWLYSESFGVFAYGGLIKPLVVAKSGTEPSVSQAASVLGSIQVALGVGAFLQVGPQWFLRLDAGVDQIALGLNLRY
jgi:hypothetical protein